MKVWCKLQYLILLAISMPLTAQTLTFSVVPQQSASRLAMQWSPILKDMSKFVGQEIIFATAPNIPIFEARLKKGEYSFAYMNPYHFVVFNKEPGYQAVAHAKDKKIKGIIVVRKDSGITKPEQLNGKQLAFPAPAAFAASILTRTYLTNSGIHFTPKYVSSHDSVYLSVAKGLYPAGGGVMRTFKAMKKEIRDQLVPMWITKGYTPHAVAVNPSVDPNITKKVQTYLTQLASTKHGRQLLEPLKIKGFVKANNHDWDDVRKLDIDLLSTK